jgi:hypothetical protein
LSSSAAGAPATPRAARRCAPRSTRALLTTPPIRMGRRRSRLPGRSCHCW